MPNDPHPWRDIHRDTKPLSDELTPPERQTRHVRLLFWHCYVFDNDIDLRTGQPPLISDSDCDLTPPEGYIENHFVLPLSGDHICSSFFANESPSFPASYG
ncbi:hypothetical protein B0T10DRAFT_497616 [Thelonectria olida]|uniref:Transcription factor domain-containing protein n=1 Tax=Thelonectria olida TaxID=1576542 RepID=A0A9P8VUU3_9HYPO|nr:hypothetical protein B0T10DRAFT_497616 [Thelonectria olida]